MKQQLYHCTTNNSDIDFLPDWAMVNVESYQAKIKDLVVKRQIADVEEVADPFHDAAFVTGIWADEHFDSDIINDTYGDGTDDSHILDIDEVESDSDYDDMRGMMIHVSDTRAWITAYNKHTGDEVEFGSVYFKNFN
jgi:hypothetical protein